VTGTSNGHVVTAVAEHDPPRVSTRLRGYAWALFALGAGTGGALAVAGAPWPEAWPVLLLGALVALSLNRLAFFPSEWSATAEAAVLVAAVVGFAGASGGGLASRPALLGPWAVAFSCGPLDLVHWRQRAFWRMAYNSGNRMLAALLAAVAFSAVRSAVDAHTLGFALGALAAALALALVDLVFFVGFEGLRGRSPRDAVRDDLLYDSLTVPLGLCGAAAGWVAAEAGWWAGAVLLLPAPFVPELVLVRARRGLGMAAPVAGCALVVIGVVALVAPLPEPVALVGIVGVALAVGLELRTDHRQPVPPLVVTAVVAGLVVGVGAELAAAVIAAVVATATAAIVGWNGRWWAPALAGVAAAGGAAVVDARPSRAAVVAAALVFEFAVVTPAARLVWTAPLVAASVALAFLWRVIGGGGAVVFGVGLFAAAATAARWGSLPWASRWLRRCTRAPTPRLALLGADALALGLACAAQFLPAPRDGLVFAASAVACAVATMAMVGVRQWRFAPRRRVRDSAFVCTATVAVVLAYPALALEGRGWGLALLVGALGACSGLAWPGARRAEEAAEPAGLGAR